MRERIIAFRNEIAARLREHAFAAWIVAAVAVIIICAVAVGTIAFRRAARLDEHAVALRNSLGRVDSWRTGFQPASPAESVAWLEAEQAVRDLGLTLSTRVALAEVLSRRAEQIGISQPRIRLESSDSISFAPLVSGHWSFELSPTALRMELDADPLGVAEFLSVLPPQVDVRNVWFMEQDSSSVATLLLIAYRTPE